MEQTDVIKYWKGGGENLPVPYTLFALSPLKQSPRIVAIILIAAAEKQIATQNWSPCIESIPRSNLARLTEIRATASLGLKKRNKR